MSTMEELLEVESVRLFGSYLHYKSKLLEDNGALKRQVFEQLAQGFSDQLYKAGCKWIVGSERVELNEELESGVSGMALKLEAAFTSEPAQFVAYCAYKMEELRDKLGYAEREAVRLRELLSKYAPECLEKND